MGSSTQRSKKPIFDRGLQEYKAWSRHRTKDGIDDGATTEVDTGSGWKLEIVHLLPGKTYDCRRRNQEN